jgi:hypothetical protein
MVRPLRTRSTAAAVTWVLFLGIAALSLSRYSSNEEWDDFWLILGGGTLLVVAVQVVLAVRRRSGDYLVGVVLGLGLSGATVLTFLWLLAGRLADS